MEDGNLEQSRLTRARAKGPFIEESDEESGDTADTQEPIDTAKSSHADAGLDANALEDSPRRIRKKECRLLPRRSKSKRTRQHLSVAVPQPHSPSQQSRHVQITVPRLFNLHKRLQVRPARPCKM